MLGCRIFSGYSSVLRFNERRTTPQIADKIGSSLSMSPVSDDIRISRETTPIHENGFMPRISDSGPAGHFGTIREGDEDML
jgi:hypothetical protein